jgi:hypothetical protein
MSLAKLTVITTCVGLIPTLRIGPSLEIRSSQNFHHFSNGFKVEGGCTYYTDTTH